MASTKWKLWKREDTASNDWIKWQEITFHCSNWAELYFVRITVKFNIPQVFHCLVFFPTSMKHWSFKQPVIMLMVFWRKYVFLSCCSYCSICAFSDDTLPAFFNCLNPMCTMMRAEIFKDLEVSKSWQRLIISNDLILGSDSFSLGVSIS